MKLATVVVGEIGTNCYLVGCERTSRAVIIDPGAEPEEIERAVRKLGVQPIGIVNTHGHADHIAANDAFDLPVSIHDADADCLTDPARNLSSMFAAPLSFRPAARRLADGDEIPVGDIILRVVHTPGHTPGGICLIDDRDAIAFTGDTLFRDGYGRTDLPGGDETALFASIENKLFVLPDATIIYPGHGPSSTIAHEKRGL